MEELIKNFLEIRDDAYFLRKKNISAKVRNIYAQELLEAIHAAIKNRYIEDLKDIFENGARLNIRIGEFSFQNLNSNYIAYALVIKSLNPFYKKNVAKIDTLIFNEIITVVNRFKFNEDAGQVPDLIRKYYLQMTV